MDSTFHGKDVLKGSWGRRQLTAVSRGPVGGATRAPPGFQFTIQAVFLLRGNPSPPGGGKNLRGSKEGEGGPFMKTTV